MLPKIVTPTAKLKIPSTGKPVSVRPFLVKEEKILLMAKQAGGYTDILGAIKQVVGNCLLEKMDVNKLALFDIEYLFLKLRALSVNNIVKVTYKDNEDEKEYPFDIDLDKIEVKFPDKVEKVIVLNDEYSLLMKYPESAIYSEKEFQSDDPSLNIEFFVTNTIDKICQGDKMIDLRNATKPEITEFVESIPAKAYDQIKEFWNNIPKLHYEIKYTNAKGTERSIVLEKLADFFTF
jgi:hypothetical protein